MHCQRPYGMHIKGQVVALCHVLLCCTAANFSTKQSHRSDGSCPLHCCRIPSEHLLGVTALLLTCSYKGQEFVRVGYYVNIEYVDPDIVQLEHLPNPPRIDKLQRNVMAGDCSTCQTLTPCQTCSP